MKAIVAVNNLGYIGKSGGLPWVKHMNDLFNFKRLTMQSSILISGYNTFQTLPKLKDRKVTVAPRIITDEYIQDLNKIYSEPIWCIGGKAIYEKLCHLFTELHISYIDDDTIGDVMFPDSRNLKSDCKIIKYHW